jgi:hypothetical protein
MALRELSSLSGEGERPVHAFVRRIVEAAAAESIGV